MADYIAPDLPPLPPVPPRPVEYNADTKAQWDSYWSWCEQSQRRADFLSIDLERWNVQQHRLALEAHWATCNPEALAAQFAPTIDAVLAAWTSLDARLAQLAAALRPMPSPTPAPPIPFPL